MTLGQTVGVENGWSGTVGVENGLKIELYRTCFWFFF